MRYILTVFLAISALLVSVAPAWAQDRVGLGVGTQTLEQTCTVRVTAFRDGVEELRTLLDAVLNCHRQGKLYDSGSCRDPYTPAHAWEENLPIIRLKMQEGTNPSNLVYLPNAASPENFRGPQGPDGDDAVCPINTTPVTSSSGGSSSSSSSSSGSSSGASSGGSSTSSSSGSSSGGSSTSSTSSSSSTSTSSGGSTVCTNCVWCCDSGGEVGNHCRWHGSVPGHMWPCGTESCDTEGRRHPNRNYGGRCQQNVEICDPIGAVCKRK